MSVDNLSDGVACGLVAAPHPQEHETLDLDGWPADEPLSEQEERELEEWYERWHRNDAELAALTARADAEAAKLAGVVAELASENRRTSEVLAGVA
jgi:hypothetical protein